MVTAFRIKVCGLWGWSFSILFIEGETCQDSWGFRWFKTCTSLHHQKSQAWCLLVVSGLKWLVHSETKEAKQTCKRHFRMIQLWVRAFAFWGKLSASVNGVFSMILSFLFPILCHSNGNGCSQRLKPVRVVPLKCNVSLATSRCWLQKSWLCVDWQTGLTDRSSVSSSWTRTELDFQSFCLHNKLSFFPDNFNVAVVKVF